MHKNRNIFSISFFYAGKKKNYLTFSDKRKNKISEKQEQYNSYISYIYIYIYITTKNKSLEHFLAKTISLITIYIYIYIYNMYIKK